MISPLSNLPPREGKGSAKATIAAIATPSGRGGVGIIRVSGPLALTLAETITGKTPKIRQAVYAEFRDHHDDVIDEGVIIYFKGPHSFTGEDVVEFQGHGSPITLDLLLKRLFMLGAVPAKPGEFSERAFLNDKLDLVQAESIADLIEAASERASRLAMKNLKGAFSNKVTEFQHHLTELRVYVEAAIDFPEEEIDFLGDGKILNNLSGRIDELALLLKQAKQGVVLREGLTVVLAGYPNAGKSTLLNCLSGKESAIVTDIPGTTRDVMREQILIDGMPIHIIDTAGLRESIDPIEQEGIRRAWREIQEADHVILLIDQEHFEQLEIEKMKQDILSKIHHEMPCTIVVNKMDKCVAPPDPLHSLQSHADLFSSLQSPADLSPPLQRGAKGDFLSIKNLPVFYISAKYEQGIEPLRAHLSQAAGLDAINSDSGQENCFMARRRHLDALERALECLKTGKIQLVQHKAGELLAEDLRQAQKSLSDITGEFSSDDLLGKIFSSFCIGK